jgi:hypothetical protein
VVEYYIWVCTLLEQGAPPPLEETILINRAQRHQGAKIIRRFAKKQRLHQEVKRLDTVLVSYVPPRGGDRLSI